LGLTHDATASQKKMKSRTTPFGFMLIIMQIPRNEESFSSLSRMFRSDVHLHLGLRKKLHKNQKLIHIASLCRKRIIGTSWWRPVMSVHCMQCRTVRSLACIVRMSWRQSNDSEFQTEGALMLKTLSGNGTEDIF